MNHLGLTYDDLEAVTRACAAIRVGPSGYLKDFLTRRLAETFPETSSRIRELTPEQVEILRCYLQERQSWLNG